MEAGVEADRRPRRPSLFVTMLLSIFACAPAALAQGALNEWDAMLAVRDIVRRSIALEFIKVDPYQLIDPVRRDADPERPLCTLRTVKEGLVNGTCNPSAMKRCGARCIELPMDPLVYARAASQISADLQAPCKRLPAVKLTQGRRDSHPSFFYLSRNRAVDVLGCSSLAFELESATFRLSTLTIRYRTRAE
jgi:hypothetical protein